MRKQLLGSWRGRSRLWLRAIAALPVCLILAACGCARTGGESSLKATSTPLPLPTNKDYTETSAGLNLEMVWVPRGTFNMGGAFWEDDEKPIHAVTLDGFWLGKCEVTNAQYRSFLSDSGYDGATEADEDYLTHFKSDTELSSGGDYPVLYISWHNARAFCEWLSRKTGLSYSLPTEAQWEYACRAGNSGKWHCGDDESEIGRYAWFGDNSGGKTHPVGTKEPNAFGLYDMHGNVMEWCLDWHDADYYGRSPSTNPVSTKPTDGAILSIPTKRRAVNRRSPSTNSVIIAARVLRGGGWNSNPSNCRAANRHKNPPNSASRLIGFRASRTQE